MEAATTPQPPVPAPVAGRIALVTGAGSGIGEACARALRREGWTVAFVGRRADRLHAAAHAADDTARTAGVAAGGSIVLPCDVADAGQVAQVFADVERRFGRLDLLFNNAGGSLGSVLPDELSVADWDHAVAVNLSGAFYCLRQAFALMRRQTPRGGRIINNGSISAHAPRPGSIAYTTTKHAMTGLTKSAALDGRAFDIAVGQIDIGNAVTPLTQRMAEGVLQADGSRRTEARMPVEDVAETFMAMARLPLTSNVLFMTVMATAMPYVGRG